MDPIFLARLKFALTASFHFIFPPITIGMAIIILWFLIKAGNDKLSIYYQLGRFWSRILTITFAIGVATGITMEFQFGTNWASYSRFVGDIFGAPLAAEVIFSFFLESTFIAVLAYGWDKFSVRTLRFASFMVALGAVISAFWILVANSWMQTPSGYFIAESGRAELLSFKDAVFNPSMLPRFFHTISASLNSGAIFILGICAYLKLKGKNSEIITRSFKTAVVAAFLGAILQLASGHIHAIQVANTQPEKLATIEGLEITQSRAPAVLFGIPDEKTRTLKSAIKIPAALSFMISGDPETVVAGMNEFETSELPPFAITFASFHLMVAIGFYLIGLTFCLLIFLRREKIIFSKPVLWLTFATLPLPTIANTLGWTTAEVGRQPWAVYHILKTANSVSPTVSATQILSVIILFSIIYALFFFVWVYLVRRAALNLPVTNHEASPLP